LFDLIHVVITDHSSITRITKEVVEDFASENVVYRAENYTKGIICFRTFLSCCIYGEKKSSKRSYIEAVLEGLRVVSSVDVAFIPYSEETKTKSLLSPLLLDASYKSAVETVMLALEMRHFGVVGIDLSGNPAVGEWITYLLALKFAREQGLYVTLHCGEVSNSKEIHDMLDFLLQRIGHACFFKEEHWRRLKSSNIPRIMICMARSRCPLLVINQLKFDLYNAKHPLVLCTDDSGVFSTSLSNEYKIAAFSFGLGQKELFELSKNAIEFIFADNVVKEDLRKKFNSAAKNLEL
ncbi:Adenosine deaminase-like protein, partial [Glycine soja]